jgi:hypothetical protein
MLEIEEMFIHKQFSLNAGTVRYLMGSTNRKWQGPDEVLAKDTNPF